MRPWDQWVECVGDHPPLGPELRAVHHGRAWRLHSGDMVRVPTTDEEVAEARRRHRKAAAWALGLDATCLVLFTTWSRSSPHGDWAPAPIPSNLRGSERSREWLEDGATFWLERRWSDEATGELVMPSVLDRSEGRIAVLSCRTGAVYCPYDGGADVVMRSPLAAAEARQVFTAWCP